MLLRRFVSTLRIPAVRFSSFNLERHDYAPRKETYKLISDNTAKVDIQDIVGLEQSLHLQLITPQCPLFVAPESESPFELDPFWAILWPGSFAISKHLIENPHVVAGKRVLDFAAGCGVGAIVSARLGASSVCVNEIDLLAIDACIYNMCVLNPDDCRNFYSCGENLVGNIDDVAAQFDVVLAGDVCYEEELAEQVTTWLSALAEKG